ncbi:MAG: hypothetical protein ABIG44_14695 [Planctomycetota bacterium]
MKNRWTVLGAMFLASFVTLTTVAQEKACCSSGQSASKALTCDAGKSKSQTVCPIEGGKIDKKIFVDMAGYRMYACCPACLPKIKADPTKAVATLVANGEKPELYLAVCSKCGDLKGTAECCNPDAKKCSECGLNKGSIGCCKDLKAAACQKNSATCPKGSAANCTAQCSAADAKKCSGCTAKKGSSTYTKDSKSSVAGKDVVLCAGCGQAKGSAKCCQPDAKTSSTSDLSKGAAACCQDQKSADQQDIVLCIGCGEVKGNGKCCQPDTQKCSKCSLNKGAPGCCKLTRFLKDRS